MTAFVNALVDLLGKPIAESSALYIPTAVYANPMVRSWSGYRRDHHRSVPLHSLCDLGWKSLGVLELTALPSIDEERWLPLVQETDALLVEGGDALYLCYWMRQSGLADLLPELRRETVYVGLSAGSMVMAPSIGEDFVRWKPPTGGDRTLGLVDFAMFPHLDHPDMPDNSLANAERWAAGMPVPAYCDRRSDRHQSGRRSSRSGLRRPLETVYALVLRSSKTSVAQITLVAQIRRK